MTTNLSCRGSSPAAWRSGVDFRSFNLGSWGSVPRKLAAGRGFPYEAPDLHLVFECTRVRCEQRHHRRQLLYLESLHDDPAAAAADIIARLLATPTDQWVQTFPGH